MNILSKLVRLRMKKDEYQFTNNLNKWPRQIYLHAYTLIIETYKRRIFTKLYSFSRPCRRHRHRRHLPYASFWCMDVSMGLVAFLLLHEPMSCDRLAKVASPLQNYKSKE